MFPDDDLDWSWRGVNLALAAMREFHLMFTHPAPELAGYPTYDVTRRLPARGPTSPTLPK